MLLFFPIRMFSCIDPVRVRDGAKFPCIKNLLKISLPERDCFVSANLFFAVPYIGHGLEATLETRRPLVLLPLACPGSKTKLQARRFSAVSHCLPLAVSWRKCDIRVVIEFTPCRSLRNLRPAFLFGSSRRPPSGCSRLLQHSPSCIARTISGNPLLQKIGAPSHGFAQLDRRQGKLARMAQGEKRRHADPKSDAHSAAG